MPCQNCLCWKFSCICSFGLFLLLIQALLLAYTTCDYINQNEFSKPIQNYLHSYHVQGEIEYIWFYIAFFFLLWAFKEFKCKLEFKSPSSGELHIIIQCGKHQKVDGEKKDI